MTASPPQMKSLGRLRGLRASASKCKSSIVVGLRGAIMHAQRSVPCCSVLSVNSVVAFRLRKQELERDEPGTQRRQVGRHVSLPFVARESAKTKTQSQIVDEEQTVSLVQELAVGAQVGNRTQRAGDPRRQRIGAAQATQRGSRNSTSCASEFDDRRRRRWLRRQSSGLNVIAIAASAPATRFSRGALRVSPSGHRPCNPTPP